MTTNSKLIAQNETGPRNTSRRNTAMTIEEAMCITTLSVYPTISDRRLMAAFKVIGAAAINTVDPEYLVRLAMIHDIGIGVPKSTNKMHKALRIACKIGDCCARVILADCYLQGRGVKKNTQEAIALLEQASAQDDPNRGPAAFRLTWLRHILKYVDILNPSDVAAVQYSANRGDPQSQLILAHMYALGWGVEHDMVKAGHYHQAAACSGLEAALVGIINDWLGLDSIVRIIESWSQRPAQTESLRRQFSALVSALMQNPDGIQGEMGERTSTHLWSLLDRLASANDQPAIDLRGSHTVGEDNGDITYQHLEDLANLYRMQDPANAWMTMASKTTG